MILVEAKQEGTDSSNTSGQAAARPGEGQLIIEANPGVSGSQTGSGQTEAGQDSKPAADVKPGSSQPGSSTGTDSGSNPPQAAVIQGAAPGRQLQQQFWQSGSRKSAAEQFKARRKFPGRKAERICSSRWRRSRLCCSGFCYTNSDSQPMQSSFWAIHMFMEEPV